MATTSARDWPTASTSLGEGSYDSRSRDPRSIILTAVPRSKINAALLFTAVLLPGCGGGSKPPSIDDFAPASTRGAARLPAHARQTLDRALTKAATQRGSGLHEVLNGSPYRVTGVVPGYDGTGTSGPIVAAIAELRLTHPHAVMATVPDYAQWKSGRLTRFHARWRSTVTTDVEVEVDFKPYRVLAVRPSAVHTAKHRNDLTEWTILGHPKLPPDYEIGD